MYALIVRLVNVNTLVVRILFWNLFFLIFLILCHFLQFTEEALWAKALNKYYCAKCYVSFVTDSNFFRLSLPLVHYELSNLLLSGAYIYKNTTKLKSRH